MGRDPNSNTEICRLMLRFCVKNRCGVIIISSSKYLDNISRLKGNAWMSVIKAHTVYG
jgi:hypothetical protein